MSAIGQSQRNNKTLIHRIQDLEAKIDETNKKLDMIIDRMSALSAISLYAQIKQLEKINKKLNEVTMIPSLPLDIPVPDDS